MIDPASISDGDILITENGRRGVVRIKPWRVSGKDLWRVGANFPVQGYQAINLDKVAQVEREGQVIWAANAP